jgi:Xaa-Pro aminopeptidase
MFVDRRRRFMSQMQGGVAVLFAAPERVRSNDTNYRFRQDTYFHYLTGFPETGAAAVLIPGHPEHEFVLFVRPRNRERETWDGRRYGPEGALEHFGADAAYPIEHLDDFLSRHLENADRLYYGLGRYPERDAQVLRVLDAVRAKSRLGVKAPGTIADPAEILNEMRLLKTPEEIEIMRRAAVISAEAHRNAMRHLEPEMREYEVEAVIEFTFRRRGASGPAYNSIVGGGVNATILHYTENEDVCRDGDLLLVDAGAEYQGYAADITRTYPVSGRFTEEQNRVYGIVLDAQLRAIDAARPGARFDDVHQAALRRLVEGLVELDVLAGGVDDLIAAEAYKPYYMHKTSHWIGMDVHDVGAYRNGVNWRKLQPGMVLTVEPGLYFAPDLEEVPAPYRGMGVRIEDDVLVTEGDPDVLTRQTPKAVAEIESIMAEPAAAAV